MSIRQTSNRQNLLLHVGQGHFDPSHVSGFFWSWREANLQFKWMFRIYSCTLSPYNQLSGVITWETYIPFSHTVDAPHRPAIAGNTGIFWIIRISRITSP